jgi:5-carboxymethyl-2-hydroxymuconate isomerase
MGAGRTAATQKRAGDAVLATAKAHFDPLMAQRLIGITLNVDESPGQVYDGKHSNIHPLFK